MSDTIVRDLKRKWVEDFHSFAEQRIGVASKVLNNQDVTLLLVAFLADVVSSVGCTVANQAKPGSERFVFDELIASVFREVERRGDRAMVLVEQHRAKASA